MVFNFIRIDKTILLPDGLFLTFLICIATFTTRTHTNNTILKPLSKLGISYKKDNDFKLI
ncbi:hypothetical protein LEP1GSC083_3020 [Leptospira interrogans serovar Pyrogenes str. L0374]|uniref:Uncharacterized protein n=1 Tax=Leptospira interrogans serovar Pyrogenes str. L0374 TaxID=1049928 RepID=M6KDT7_LEPIR|nr:hypothetical protein LEP1GSC077_0316 [Leptospira interrogans str. C10069]EMN32344.1 hypothetical protein LEP1GSC083_3020 [Leptospira interrogans serovar Pyrogenes str. L0374]EMN60398.1 hypothetical protein LEP1GSC092_2090 [Leptospira interrogans serovar Pyrogenes str. R168]